MSRACKQLVKNREMTYIAGGVGWGGDERLIQSYGRGPSPGYVPLAEGEKGFCVYCGCCACQNVLRRKAHLGFDRNQFLGTASTKEEPSVQRFLQHGEVRVLNAIADTKRQPVVFWYLQTTRTVGKVATRHKKEVDTIQPPSHHDSNLREVIVCIHPCTMQRTPGRAEQESSSPPSRARITWTRLRVPAGGRPLRTAQSQQPGRASGLTSVSLRVSCTRTRQPLTLFCHREH